MLKRMKLASKLALVLGVFLTVIFAAMIVVTAVLSGRAITTSISGELTAISDANGDKVQQIFDAAERAATDMQSYLESAYQTARDDPGQMELPTDPEAAALCRSTIYDKVLTSLNYDVENYLRETARNTAANNQDVAGVGVMFEPYQFQADMRDYAFYISSAAAGQDVRPFGAYETYSRENYYSLARDSGTDVVTEPYEYEGGRLISYASPILSGGAVRGVVVADINLDHFSKIQTASDKYPSMYATVYDGDGDIIYDTEDAADIGQNVSAFTPREADLAAIRAGFTGGQTFSVVTTREDGRQVARFYTPIRVGSETWWSQTALDRTDMTRPVRQSVTLLAGLSAAALLVLLAGPCSSCGECSNPSGPSSRLRRTSPWEGWTSR